MASDLENGETQRRGGQKRSGNWRMKGDSKKEFFGEARIGIALATVGLVILSTQPI